MWAKKQKEHKEKQEKDMDVDGEPMRTVTARRRQNLAAGSFRPNLTGGKRSEPEDGKNTDVQASKTQAIEEKKD